MARLLGVKKTTIGERRQEGSKIIWLVAWFNVKH